MSSESIAKRLALLDGVSLTQADRDSIAAELAAFEAALAALEPLAEETPWLSLPVQPYASEGEHGRQ